MARDTSPYIVGDFWLDKRRDGKAADIWQIARYAPGSRSVVYKSTKCRTVDLEQAKTKINAHHERATAEAYQPNVDAKVIPQLMLYIREKSERNEIVNIAQSKSSMRVFIGFMMQDEIGVNATFADLSKAVWRRFITWRSGSHEYSVEWNGKTYAASRPNGVSGEAIQRNLDDVRAALNHAEEEERVTAAPKVRSVDKKLRSKPRNVRLSIKQLGAILGYAKLDDIGRYRWIQHMLATAVRPDAGLAFDPQAQIDGELIDLHPKDWPLTDKMNATVPMIAPMQPVYKAWANAPHGVTKSSKTWWRTMRKLLGLDVKVVPKTIRHTVATMLRSKSVPGGEISGLLGHDDPEMNKTSGVYAKYDPRYLGKAKRALTIFFEQVNAEADKWAADHMLTKANRGQAKSLDKRPSDKQGYSRVS